MAAVRPLRIAILGDSRNAVQAFSQVSKGSLGLRRELGRPLAALGLGISIAATVQAARAGLNDMLQAASAVTESSQAIDVLFGRAAGSVQKFASQGAEALGASKQELLSYAQTFGVFGKVGNIRNEALAAFSQQFTQLAVDLASFRNTSVEDAAGAISSAFAGEIEPLRKYGILLNETALRNEAFNLKLISTTKKVLTPQQRIVATQSLILKQSTDAQGDRLRTAGTFANRQRTITALFADYRREIGQKFIPTAIKGQEVVQRFFREMQSGKGAGGSFQRLTDRVANSVVKTLLPNLATAAKAALSFAEDFAAGINFGGDVRKVFTGIGKGLKAGVDGIRAAYPIFRKALDQYGTPVLEFGKKYGPKLWEGVQNGARAAGQFLGKMGDTIKSVYQRVGPPIRAFVTDVFGALKSAYTELKPVVKEFLDSVFLTVQVFSNTVSQGGGIIGLLTSLSDILKQGLVIAIPIVADALGVLLKVLGNPTVGAFASAIVTVVIPLRILSGLVVGINTVMGVGKGIIGGYALAKAFLGRVTGITTGKIAAESIALKINSGLSTISAGATAAASAIRSSALTVWLRTAALQVQATASLALHTIAEGISRGSTALWVGIQNSAILAIVKRGLAQLRTTAHLVASTVASGISTTATLVWTAATDKSTYAAIGAAVKTKALAFAQKAAAAASLLAAGAIKGVSVALAFLSANPVFLIIAAVVALVAGLVYLEVKYKFLSKAASAAWEGIGKGAVALYDFLARVFPAIGSALAAPFKAAYSVIGKLIGGIGKAFSDLGNGIVKIADSIGKTLVNAFKIAMNAVIRVVNAPIDAINAVLNKASGGKVGNLPKIPALAKGGIVTGPTLALIGEAGPEAVVPLPKGGFGGGNQQTVYNIEVKAGIGDPASIGSAVVNTLRAYERQTGKPVLRTA